jgi:large exoprotein involved in heme utilization and adhesion
VRVTGGSLLSASTFGVGDAGDISITVRDAATFDGVGRNGLSSSVGSQVGTTGVGQGGTLTLTAGALNITNGARLSSSTGGQGDAGDVFIAVRNTVTFDGVESNGFGSFSGSQVGPNAVGQGGALTLTAGYINVTNGAQLTSSTFGQGNAGDISITVRDIANFDGVGSNRFSSGAGSTVAPRAVDQGGTLTLTAGSLNVTNGAQLNASTFGQGDAGNVSISVRDTATFDSVGSNGFRSGAGSEVGRTGVGHGGTLTLTAGSLNVTDGAQLTSSTFGQGNAGDVSISVRDIATFDGVGSNGFSSFAGSQVGTKGMGQGGTLTLTAGSLNVFNGAVLSSSTFGQGNAGDVSISVRDTATFDGVGSHGFSSFAGSQVDSTSEGQGGTLTLAAGSLNVTNGAQLTSSTFGQGDAGDISISVRDTATFDGIDSYGFRSFAGSEVGPTGVGQGGTLTLTARVLNVTNGAALSSSARGQGNAGGIVLRIRDTLRVTDGSIETTSRFTSGGSIDIASKSIRLSGDGDITTSVFSGAGGGGNITLSANSILALGDSDILAFARDGRGGNITLNTRAFFGQNYRPAPFGTNPVTLQGNNRVDINASGTISGIITLPDLSFLQNGLNQLPNSQIDTNALLANSCIVRTLNRNNSFYVTGSSSLPLRPGDPPAVPYPTGELRATVVRSQESGVSSVPRAPGKRWQKGDPIIEPDGVYQLPDGQLILSRECTHE